MFVSRLALSAVSVCLIHPACFLVK